jgi:hypothetical protein
VEAGEGERFSGRPASHRAFYYNLQADGITFPITDRNRVWKSAPKAPSEEELVESGSNLTGDGKPSPFMKVLQEFLRIFRHGQVALGLARPRARRDRGLRVQDVGWEYGERRVETPLKPKESGTFNITLAEHLAVV